MVWFFDGVTTAIDLPDRNRVSQIVAIGKFHIELTFDNFKLHHHTQNASPNHNKTPETPEAEETSETQPSSQSEPCTCLTQQQTVSWRQFATEAHHLGARRVGLGIGAYLRAPIGVSVMGEPVSDPATPELLSVQGPSRRRRSVAAEATHLRQNALHRSACYGVVAGLPRRQVSYDRTDAACDYFEALGCRCARRSLRFGPPLVPFEELLDDPWEPLLRFGLDEYERPDLLRLSRLRLPRPSRSSLLRELRLSRSRLSRLRSLCPSRSLLWD